MAAVSWPTYAPRWSVLLLCFCLASSTSQAQPAPDLASRAVLRARLAQSFAIADYNRDGVDDVAVADFLSDAVHVWQGDPAGAFQTRVVLRTDRGPRSIVAADLDSDGVIDLAVSELFAGAVRVFRGRGDGQFDVSGVVRLAPGVAAIAGGDFDGDGRTDVAAGNVFSGSVMLLRREMDGTWTQSLINQSSAPTLLMTRKIDADAIDDLVVIDADALDATVIRAQGGGAFDEPYAAEQTSLLPDPSGGRDSVAVRDVVRLAMTTGDAQIVRAASLSPEALVVQVADRGGAAGPGETVRFSRLSGEAVLVDAAAQEISTSQLHVTDREGRASARVVAPILPDVSVIAATLALEQTTAFGVVSVGDVREIVAAMSTELARVVVDVGARGEYQTLLDDLLTFAEEGSASGAVRQLARAVDLWSAQRNGASDVSVVTAEDLGRRLINQIMLVGVSTLATNEAITCNVPLRRAIEVQTETDTFRFQVSTANQRVHVSVALESQAAGFFSPGWRLVNASGTPLPCEVSGFAAGERDCGPLAVGGYAVQVIDLGRNGTGAYSVHIQRLNASAPRCGVTTSCDVPVDGTINMRADTDIFSFSVSTANQRVHVSLARVTQTAGFFSPGWRLISPAGTPVACEGISDFAAGERDCGPLAATGSYAVEVMDLGLNGTGTYNVQVQRLNASAPRCGGSTACDTPLSGTIGSRADTDIFSFPVTTANQRVHVSLALQTQTAGFFSPGWRLISPAGTPVTCEGISDFAAGERDCGPLATTGSYAVEVIDLGLNGTGTFSLQVQRLNASAPRCGGSIACNVPVTGTISLRADTDIFSFNGTGGATIRVQLTLLTQTSGFFSPGWRLVNAAGAPVPCGTISDFAAGTRNCTLPVTGSYAVEILDVGLNGTGTYRVTVSGACALTTTSSTVRGTRTNGLITPAR